MEKLTELIQPFRVGKTTKDKIHKIASKNRRKVCELIRIILEDLPEDYICRTKNKE